MKNLKKIVSFVAALILVTVAFFSRSFLVSTVASDSYYETLKIASTSLNGNTIWGAGESFDAIVSAGGLDEYAAFYSATNKTAGGLDNSGSLSIDNIPYKLNWSGANAYDGTDTIRLYTGNASARMTLETIGAYEQIYVLGTAGGPGEGNYANFSVVLNYTDGTSDTTNYKLYDWYDATPVSGVYKYPGAARRLVVKSQSNGRIVGTDYEYEGTVTGAPYLQSATINANPKKLLKSIDFKMTGKDTSGLFCGIYAVTGMVNVAAPNPVENIYVSKVTETTALINWSEVSGATTYRLDVSLDPNFTNILENYNNLQVDGTSLLTEGLNPETTYYARVRAENVNGQSISSDPAAFTTLVRETPSEESEDIKPVIDVNTNGYEPGTWTTEPVTLEVEHLSNEEGETKFYYSTDGKTWLDYSEKVVFEDKTDDDGITFSFKAVSEAGLESEVVEVLVKKKIIDYGKIDDFESLVRDELPDSENLEEDDESTIEEAIDRYEELTDDEKELVDPEIIEKYEEIIDEYYHGKPSLSVTGDTENWKVSDIAEIIAKDVAGIEGIYLSTDKGETWEKLTDYDSIAEEITENGSYKFKAVDNFGNEAVETIVYTNLDPVKPVLELNSHGYELGSWTNKNVTLSVKNIANNISPVTIYVSTDLETWENYTEATLHTEDTEKAGITYYYKAVSAAGLESDIVEGNIKKDTISPTGTIELGDNSWNSFLNTITFGLFFNETKEFRLNAEDELSGVAKVEYLLLEKDFERPEEAIKSTEWAEANKAITINPEKDFVVYFKVADNAGNTTIINSDGVVLDTTPATIEGYVDGRTYKLEEGKIYYLTQKIILSDNKALGSLEINDEKIEIPENRIIELPGNVEAENRIILKDRAGNITELTIKTGKIIENNLDLEHANKDDVKELEREIDRLKEILDNPDADPTEEEEEIINDLIKELETTIEEIEKVEEKVEDIEERYEKIPEIEAVTSDDKEEIENLIEEIEEILEEDRNHLTDEEIEELEEILDDLNKKLDLIDELGKELEEIKDEVEDYDLETVTSDDKEELEELKERIEELEKSQNLTDEEKEELEKEKEKVEELLKRIDEVEKKLEEIKEENKPIENINKDNVTPEDQTGLEDAQAGYVEALGVFDGNFSLSELFDINNAINIINSALDVLDQVAEFEAMVSKLPNPDDVDYSYRTVIKAAQVAYSELSDYAKTLVGPSLLSKYKAVIAAYQAFLDGSPLLTAFETLDVFWWAITTFFIIGVFVITTKRTRKRYSNIEDDSDNF